MKVFSSPTQKIGKIGEDIACEYIERRGFVVVERNYSRKWGEIDIIASFGDIVHFIEVKSVSCESFDSISHETNGYRPEEQLHRLKQSRLHLIIETYVLEHGVREWEFDLVCVYINRTRRAARVKILKDLIF